MNFLRECAFNCSHCFGSRGNLTSEKAEMKWVWVEILCYFTGLRESSRTFFRGTFPVGPFLPSPEQEICPLSGGRGRAHYGQKRPRLPQVTVDPHPEWRFEIILHAAQTLRFSTLHLEKLLQNYKCSDLSFNQLNQILWG